MTNVINFNEYKLKKHTQGVLATIGELFTYVFNLFLEYVAYPIIAAVTTIKRRRVVVL